MIFYRGALSLLSDLNKNVAVIGLINPEEEIKKRERDIVRQLIMSLLKCSKEDLTFFEDNLKVIQELKRLKLFYNPTFK